jgi:hypothetical protein
MGDSVMSHNTTKVNAQEPSAAGVVSQALNDLSDVSASSPSAGEVLVYSGGTWGAGGAAASGGVINIGQGESNAYSNSGATTITATDDVFFYDTSATNGISGSTINYVGATSWVSSVTLPAGDYIMWIRYGVEFSATGYFGFAVFDSGNTQQSSSAVIGADTTSYHFPPSVLQFRVAPTSTTTYKIQCGFASGVDTVSNQGNTPAEFSQWTIVQL